MSLIFNDNHPPKAFLDTTVLCGAIRKNGINRKILQAARFPLLYHPVVSRVCLFEFVRHASDGIGKGSSRVKYDHWEIESFLSDFINPLLEYYLQLPVNSIVGRYSIETIIRENLPLGDVLAELSGCSNEMAKQIAASQELREPLHRFDQNDFHVWVTAIKEECNVIVSSNTSRFPSRIGNIERIHPKQFYNAMNSAN